MLGMGVGALPRLPLHDLAEAVLSLNPTTEHVLDSLGSVRDIAGSRWDAAYTGSPTLAARGRPTLPRGVTFSGSGQYATTATGVPVATASVSVISIFSTSDATAATRTLAARIGTASSWRLSVNSAHIVAFHVFQSVGSNHAVQSVSGAVNDGATPHLAFGSFDGVTLRVARDNGAAGVSTSLSGSWGSGSGTALQIAAGNSLTLFPGIIYLVAYWADRVITDTERRWLYSIMAGG